jgi:hypothetical protein
VASGARILTHCNAGALATAGYGTALGVIRSAHAQGKVALVWVDETRPVMQGSRLTAWECDRDGIPHRLIADVAAASLMARGEVDLVVTGADRIAANGDTANKIGTYGRALLYDRPRARLGGGDPHRGARRRGSATARRPADGAVAHARLQPRVRRDAGLADHGDRHGTGNLPPAVSL